MTSNNAFERTRVRPSRLALNSVVRSQCRGLNRIRNWIEQEPQFTLAISCGSLSTSVRRRSIASTVVHSANAPAEFFLWWAGTRRGWPGFLWAAGKFFRLLRNCWLSFVEGASGGFVGPTLTSNNALERTVNHRGPRLAAARAAWPAAQRDR